MEEEKNKHKDVKKTYVMEHIKKIRTHMTKIDYCLDYIADLHKSDKANLLPWKHGSSRVSVKGNDRKSH